MKNVSFGAMYTINECARRTINQRKIEDTINANFQAREVRNGSNGSYPRTLDEMLEEDMMVDVYVTHKKNGNVEISLKDLKPNDMIVNGIVKDKDKIKLIVNYNLPPIKINKLITEYANKCRRLANFYSAEIANEGAARIANARKKSGNPNEIFILSALEGGE